MSFRERLEEFRHKHRIKLRLDEDSVDLACLDALDVLCPGVSETHSIDGTQFYDFNVTYKEAFRYITDNVVTGLQDDSRSKKRSRDGTTPNEDEFARLVAKSLVESGAWARYCAVDAEVAELKAEIAALQARVGKRVKELEKLHGAQINLDSELGW